MKKREREGGLVKEYFDAWYTDHRMRFPTVTPRWPEAGSDEWDAVQLDLYRVLMDLRPTKAQAANASRDMVENDKSRFRQEHPRLLREAVEKQFQAARPGQSLFNHDRDSCEQESASCEVCGGSGVSVRCLPDGMPMVIKSARGRFVAVPEVIVSCTCALGTFIWTRNGGPNGKSPMPRLGGKWLERTVPEHECPLPKGQRVQVARVAQAEIDRREKLPSDLTPMPAF